MACYGNCKLPIMDSGFFIWLANSVSGQVEPHPVLWLAIWAGRMIILSCLPDTTRWIPQKVFFFFHATNLVLVIKDLFLIIPWEQLTGIKDVSTKSVVFTFPAFLAGGFVQICCLHFMFWKFYRFAGPCAFLQWFISHDIAHMACVARWFKQFERVRTKRRSRVNERGSRGLSPRLLAALALPIAPSPLS